MKFSAKILLFGEYLVLHRSDALLIPLQKYSGQLDFIDKTDELVNGKGHSNSTIRNFYNYLLQQYDRSDIEPWFDLDKLKRDIDGGLFFRSNIPVGYGVGSSGALTAALFKKYSRDSYPEWKRNLPELKSNLALLESYFHGKSSGLDPLLSYLHKGIHMQQGKMKINDVNYTVSNPFLIDTKKSRSTGELVTLYREKNLSTEYFEAIKTKLINTNNRCINHLKKEEITQFFGSLKELSILQLEYFREMILSEYEAVWKSGIESGDYYLKLCGAGGGGYLLGFTPDKKVIERLKKEHQLKIVEI